MTSLNNPTMFLATADPQRSREFYERVLELDFVGDEPLALVFRTGDSMLRIQKVDQVQVVPYTALGWTVEDIRSTVRQLRINGAVFERYDGMGQDGDDIWRSPTGAMVAWFKDVDGHTLSLTQLG